MSGQLLLRTPDHPGDDRHARIRLHLDHPEHGELRVDFVDQRTFGSLAVDRLVPTADGEVAGFSAGVTGPWARSIPAQVAHIARDPLDPAFDDAAFLDALVAPGTGVKRVLLDQSLVSGVGNIYADEALWAVRLHGEQPASSLSRRRGARAPRGRARRARQGARRGRHELRRAVRQRQRGIRLLRALAQRLRPAGLPCPRCGTPMVREAFMNRSSHRCPRCQRLRMPRQPASA